MRLRNIILLLIPFGGIILALEAYFLWRKGKRHAAQICMPDRFRFRWDLLQGPHWWIAHPAAGRFCDICGANGDAQEPCCPGLHS